MTGDNFRAVIVYGGAAWFFLSLSVIAVILFIARYKLEYMESFLRSVKWIDRVKADFGCDNWASRIYRLNILNVVLIFPNAFVRRGEIELSELYAIPSGLRRAVKGVHCLMFVLFVILVSSHFFIKYCRPS